MIRRGLAALVVLAGLAIVALLPPRAFVVTPRASAPPVLRGAIHVHTTNSDGSGSPDTVAADAGRAGLSFVILTDHGDGTRMPDAPRYRSGVLVVDAVEISTSGGHVVVLGLPRTPYPLRGEPRDVLEDVARLGAMSIVAHPTSLKEDLRWHDPGRPFGGMEWLNFDSEWRDDRALTLLRVLLTYWFRPPESLAMVLNRPVASLEAWDHAASKFSVVGLAASDAHAKIGGDMDHGGPAAVHLPSYEQMFRTFSIALPGLTLTRNADTDAAAVLGAIRDGHVFSVIDALAHPGRLAFTARTGGTHAQAGDRLPAGHPVMLHAEIDAPPVMPTLTLYRNGAVVTSTPGSALDYEVDGEPGTYRVEAALPPPRLGASVAPWIVSNPIYIGPAMTFVPRMLPAATASQALDAGGAGDWIVEHSEQAAGAVATVGALGGTQLHFRYALGGTRAAGPFVAFATAARGASQFTRLTFTGRAVRPMRVSLQLRAAGEQGSARWRRAVYLDDMPRTIAVPFDEFTPVERAMPPSPRDVASVLFVIDTLNTALGSNGEFWIDDVRFER